LKTILQFLSLSLTTAASLFYSSVSHPLIVTCITRYCGHLKLSFLHVRQVHILYEPQHFKGRMITCYVLISALKEHQEQNIYSTLSLCDVSSKHLDLAKIVPCMNQTNI